MNEANNSQKDKIDEKAKYELDNDCKVQKHIVFFPDSNSWFRVMFTN